MPTASMKEIAFIDRAITDLDAFVAGLRPDIEPIVLTPGESAPAQIAKALQGRSALAAIHIVAHGQAGEVSFGSGPLSLETVNAHADKLRAIGRALGEDGTLLLWTCRTAQGARGHAFVEALAYASGAAVAASTKLVGARDKGGCWELDTPVGMRQTIVPLTPAGQANYAGVMATFTGTNGDDTADATNGTLIGFTGGTVTDLQDTTGDTFNALQGADTIVAGSGDDTINNFIGADSVDGGAGSDTLMLIGNLTTANLTSALDDDLKNVEFINATNMTVSFSLNLANQTEGFTINSNSPANFAIDLTGSAGADTITTGANGDIIRNFIGADSIDAGENITNTDTDTLAFSTSTDLTSAADNQLVNVERVTLTVAGLTVNLGTNQSEAFEITGSSGNDIITGGSGNDTFVGFVGADSVDGGGGTADTLRLSGSSFTDLNNALDDKLTNVEIITCTGASGTLSLANQTETEGFIINGDPSNFMNITGSAGADTITTGSNTDIITNFVGAV